jgi:C-methyltransferase C-terminal domain/Putative zinc binding domain
MQHPGKLGLPYVHADTPSSAAADYLEPEPLPCRSCGAPLVERVLDLGDQPASDWFPGPEDPPQDAVQPLELWMCTQCALVQLGAGSTVPEQPLAVESETSRRHAAARSAALVRGLGVAAGSTVREYASDHGGHWSGRLAELGLVPVTDGPADLVVDVHGLIHEADLDAALADRIGSLAPDGVLVVEFLHLLPLVRHGQFDTVRHGHTVYLSLLALRPALARHGLAVVSAEPVPVYGGSLQVIARRGGTPDPTVDAVLRAELEAGLDDPASVRSLQERVARAATALHEWLERARREGRYVVGYGAPSKAPVLLCASGVDAGLLPFTADLSPAKQGRWLPGCRVPIRSPEQLLAAKPTDVLILTWDLVDEIRAQLHEVETWGGRFVVPLPEPTVLAARPEVPS